MAPRIGVFVCRCGINIGAYVDVPKVVEYAKTLPGVAYAEENMYTCSSDGLNKMVSDYGIGYALVLARENGMVEDVGRYLVAAANAAGGADNVTAIVVHLA